MPRCSTRVPGATPIEAKSGTRNRLGYIFTHSAIVVICFGGLLDGELPIRMQIAFLGKLPVRGDILFDKVPHRTASRLSRLPKSDMALYRFAARLRSRRRER